MKRLKLEERREVEDYFEKRFGISKKIFTGYCFYSGGKGKIYLGMGVPENLDVISAGIIIARKGKSIKPTTNFIQIFGNHATRNIIKLSVEDAIRYIKGEDLKVEVKPDISDGYVILKYSGFPLGCGLLKNGKIKNMIPKAKRLDVKYI